jgi:hypothetical protein
MPTLNGLMLTFKGIVLVDPEAVFETVIGFIITPSNEAGAEAPAV